MRLQIKVNRINITQVHTSPTNVQGIPQEVDSRDTFLREFSIGLAKSLYLRDNLNIELIYPMEDYLR